MESKNALLSFR